MIGIIVGDGLRGRLNRLFIWILFSNTALMLSDTLAFFSIGKTATHFFVTNFIGNLFTFLFSYVVIACFSNWLNIYLASKYTIKRTAVYIIYGVCGFGIAMTLFSLFNDMYFIIDENNIYHRQSMYWLSQVIGVVGMALNSIEIIRRRKYFNRVEMLALGSYIVFPIIAIIIQMLYYGFVSVYISSTLTIIFIFIGMQAQYSKTLKEKELQLTQQRIAVMLSQIQPHFLYNALAGIRSLCKTDAEAARDALVKISKYLRSNMDSLMNQTLIDFKKELEHTDIYLSLEKMRFSDRINIVHDITVHNFKLPALTLQPIVENAVRHGITKKVNGGTVTIKTEETGDSFIITVTDDGIGFDPAAPIDDDESHVGIENVRSRLNMMCGGTLDIQSLSGTGTTAVITIPKGADSV